MRREGIELTGTFVATIDVDLRVGSLEETITVTGESPIVDMQRTTQQRVFDQQVIEQIPAGRSHINMVVLIPGLAAAQPGRGALADVGGTNNLQNTTFSIHGGRTSDTRLQLDGVRLGNVLSGGEFSNFVPDTGSTQEVAVDYAAMSAEQPFGGLRIDIIPREGGNTREGRRVRHGRQLRLADQQPDRRSAQSRSARAERDEEGVGHQSVGRWSARSATSCGSTARRAGRRTRTTSPASTTTRTRATRRSGLYEADTSRRGFFSLEQNGVNLRLTSQVAQKHKVSFYYDNQSRIWDDTSAGVSPESAVAYRFPVLNLAQAAWTAPMTNKLLLEARYARRGEAFGNQLPEEGDIYRDMIPVLEQSTTFFYRGKGGDGGVSGLFGYSSQKINTAVASMSYVTGSHSLKVGFSDTWANTREHVRLELVATCMFRFNNGIPNQVTLYGVPTRGESLVKGEIGLYVQDRWTIDRWTINAGVRYDGFRGGYPEQYPGSRAAAADARLHVPGGHQHEHARHHAAARRVLRSVRQREDRAQGQRSASTC